METSGIIKTNTEVGIVWETLTPEQKQALTQMCQDMAEREKYAGRREQ